MSERADRGDSAGTSPRTYGRASDSAQVYQSGANQYVTHIHVTAEERGLAVHQARQRADMVVQVLTLAVGEWAARCQELEEQARKAKAEGRAEAYAEFTERLRNAELRVMQAQRTMRQAEEQRAKAETLPAHARQELARHLRAADRDGEGTSPHDPAGTSRDQRERDDSTRSWSAPRRNSAPCARNCGSSGTSSKAEARGGTRGSSKGSGRGDPGQARVRAP
ncbi:hypothetical protein ACSNOK_11745 [Streptomyces sp. URMC 126]|uniref:hypothetical protein n=1 Tax=Streptomyces sp. URMC 126 TaxID=3423401 RepID=UPI003F1C4497